MANLSGFDANQFEPNRGFDPIPPGAYDAVIVDSEYRENKSGKGIHLLLTFEITEGHFAGRRLWTRLNLDNPNPKAEEIAKADLSAICHAVGVLTPQDSTNLHNLPLVIHVRQTKRKDTGDVVNEIKGYSKKGPPPPPSGGRASAPTSTPPWKRPQRPEQHNAPTHPHPPVSAPPDIPLDA